MKYEVLTTAKQFSSGNAEFDLTLSNPHFMNANEKTNKTMYKIFKFGGASVNSVERIQQLVSILRLHQEEKLLVVISAMGKTTNALEKVAQAFYAGQKEEALRLFQQVKD